jgi:hypothetical protein
VRIARRLNARIGRRGPVFADRYHAHVLATRREVANAVRSVTGNTSTMRANVCRQVSAIRSPQSRSIRWYAAGVTLAGP